MNDYRTRLSNWLLFNAGRLLDRYYPYYRAWETGVIEVRHPRGSDLSILIDVGNFRIKVCKRLPERDHFYKRVILDDLGIGWSGCTVDYTVFEAKFERLPKKVREKNKRWFQRFGGMIKCG